MAMRSLLGMVKALPRRGAGSAAAAVKDKKGSITSECPFDLPKFFSPDEPIHVTRAKLKEKRMRDWEELEKKSKALRRKTRLAVLVGYGTVCYLATSVVRSVAKY